MERRLAAILAADVVGYTRLMGADEAGTLDSICPGEARTSLTRTMEWSSPESRFAGMLNVMFQRSFPEHFHAGWNHPASQKRGIEKLAFVRRLSALFLIGGLTFLFLAFAADQRAQADTPNLDADISEAEFQAMLG